MTTASTQLTRSVPIGFFNVAVLTDRGITRDALQAQARQTRSLNQTRNPAVHDLRACSPG